MTASASSPPATPPQLHSSSSRHRPAPTLPGRFARSERGAVALVFALLVIPIVAVVGLAIDFGRVYSVSWQTQSALDAAALAAGRVAQIEKNNMIAQASAAAAAYFEQTRPKDVASATIQFSPNTTQTQFTVTATTWVKTPFLSVLTYVMPRAAEAGAPSGCDISGYSCLQILRTSTAELKVGGNGGSSIEVSLMLDITGSMAGQKLTDLKSAAKDLIDIVVFDNQSSQTARIAIAPFAPRVNVGSYMTAVTGMAGTKSDGRKIVTCVTERTGTYAASDVAPGSGAYMNAYDGTRNVNNTNYTWSGTCDNPGEQIKPLSTDRALLKAHIDTFSAAGSTAGQLGTAWAWYLISPEWSGIWPMQSQPGSYGDLTTLNSTGEPKLKKIAVLMTDGIYNTLLGTNYGDYSSQATTATNRAIALCDGMKLKGIVIYSVLFDLPDVPGADTALRACASSPDKFYNAATGDQLKQAFRDIALKISTLRLTH